MEFFKTYHEVVMKAMENATKTNEDAIEKGAKLMADAVQKWSYLIYLWNRPFPHDRSGCVRKSWRLCKNLSNR